MSDLGRARMLGLVGTLLPWLVIFIGTEASVVFGFFTLFNESLILVDLLEWLLVGAAVWILARLAGRRDMFWFYLTSIALGGIVGASYYAGASAPVFTSDTFIPGEPSLLVGVGVYLIGVASAFFLYLSFMSISRSFSNKWFPWCCRLILLEWVFTIVPQVGTIFGLAGFVLQVVAFNALKDASPAPVAA